MRKEDLERELGIPELRSRFLPYGRAALQRISGREGLRILDIGCGRGEPLFQLARLTDGEILGIDVDRVAVRDVQDEIERRGLTSRVTVRHVSLFETGFASESFHLLWAGGVLHILDADAAFTECHRLLASGGHLVVCETLTWFEEVADQVLRCGFEQVGEVLWKTGAWWTEYYAPLEERIRRFRTEHGDARDLEGLGRYEDEIEMVRPDPARFDCAHVILRKSAA